MAFKTEQHLRNELNVLWHKHQALLVKHAELEQKVVLLEEQLNHLKREDRYEHLEYLGQV